ncbi:phosphodiesterase [Nocardia sp. NBC_01009]|uniref:phosphodiesterase n=1 Tax=Nocardia sp. NBC_01009 TaxID=2975996 RepID=UPI003870D620|nr:phosphodiesterase [Nocardia sp. NBC_01009]
MVDVSATVVRSAFAAGARLRHARVFHPDGLALSGRLHAEYEFENLFGSGERAVIARLSKGAGLPGGVPDVLGFAFRALARDDQPWDFALATTGRSTVGRFVFTVATGWARAKYGSLMPYRFGDSMPTWVFAEPDAAQPKSASIEALAEYLHEHDLHFDLIGSPIFGPTRKLAEINLRLAHGEHRTDYFDPMLNHPAEVEIVPKVIQQLREFAYAGSRQGRGETP